MSRFLWFSVYNSFIEMDQGHVHLLIWGVMQQCMYKTKIHDIDGLRKCLMQTWFDFVADQWCFRL